MRPLTRTLPVEFTQRASGVPADFDVQVLEQLAEWRSEKAFLFSGPLPRLLVGVVEGEGGARADTSVLVLQRLGQGGCRCGADVAEGLSRLPAHADVFV